MESDGEGACVCEATRFELLRRCIGCSDSSSERRMDSTGIAAAAAEFCGVRHAIDPGDRHRRSLCPKSDWSKVLNG